MSNFNEYFKNQGAKIIVTRFLSNADQYNTKKKITSVNHYIVEEPEKPASYYTENGLTASHKVRIEYTINDEPELLYSEFEVPKEIDGAFIIEGAYRIATNKLGNDYDCRIKMSGSGDYIVNFDYDRRFFIDKHVLKVKRNNYNTGVYERPIEISYNDIDTLTGEKKELLKLTDRQSKKLQIKLDLDYKPEYITTKLIDECIAFGDDRLKDLIIDKTIESVPTGFMNFMFKSTGYISARKQIHNYFTRQGRLQDQLTSITRLAYRFFKGTQEAKSGESNLQVPPGINAMNLQSLGSKVTISKATAYNTTFSDLIDFADTPINQNTNLQNSLTISTHVTDNGILFDVYDLDFKKITIEYIDYLNSMVCASEYVDYKNNKMIPDEEGKVVVKYRMKRLRVPVEKVQLVDLHPDFRLSEISRRIPFINSTDSVRISMGTSMLKQSIPLVNAQRPLVDTGNSDELNNNILNEKFMYDSGKVKKIDEDKITIELPDKTEVEVLRRSAIKSMNDVSIYTEPKVKVGQKVKKGDVICGAVEMLPETYKVGLNTLVLFSAYKGLVNEDALVVSESYAERMKHYSIIDLKLDIRTSMSLKWIAPIGTKVKSGDDVIKIFKTVRLNEVNRALNEKLGGLFGEEGKDLTEYTTESSLKVPNNIDEAYVSDILVQEQKNPKKPKTEKMPDYSFARQSEKVMKEYDSTKDRSIIYKMFPEYIAADTLDPIIMDPEEYKIVYTVRIRLIKKTSLMVGSKVTNRYGGKGVISKIEKDEDMPLMVDEFGKQRRVEVIMNPYSTINRKIAGVMVEQELGNIAIRLHDLVDEYKNTKTGKNKIMPLIKKYYPGRYDNLDVEEFIKLHESKPIEDVYYFKVGCFSTDYTSEKVDKMMSDLGLESQRTILMPESSITDLTELKNNLPEEEYNSVVKNMTGKYVPVEKKLQCGYMTLEELYHIPSYSSKVTTSMYSYDISAKRDEPILGKGRYRETGQKIGEQELSVLLSRNAKQYLNAAREDTVKQDNQIFLNNLLGLGLTVVDSQGFNQGGSDLKSNLSKMKAKFRLKNQK